MSLTPAGEALYAARQRSPYTVAYLSRVLGTSSSMVYYVENGQRAFPMRWLPLLPPEIAVPVLQAMIEEKRTDLVGLEMLLRAKEVAG